MKARIVLIFFMFISGPLHALNSISHQWTFKGRIFDLSIPYDAKEYQACQKDIASWHREVGTYSQYGSKYLSYLRNYPCGSKVQDVALYLYEMAEDANLSRLEMANFLISFVKHYPYILDKDHQGDVHFAQTPYETLYLQKGDCEDHAILLAHLLSLFCYDALMIRTEDDQSAHLALGLAEEEDIQSQKGHRTFEYNNTTYLYCEATPCSTSACVSEVGECSSTMSAMKIVKIFDLPLDCRFYYE